MERQSERMVKMTKVSLIREQEQKLDRQISEQRGLISSIQEKAFEFRREQPSKGIEEARPLLDDDGSVYCKLANLSDSIENNNRRLRGVLSHLTELV